MIPQKYHFAILIGLVLLTVTSCSLFRKKKKCNCPHFSEYPVTDARESYMAHLGSKDSLQFIPREQKK